MAEVTTGQTHDAASSVSYILFGTEKKKERNLADANHPRQRCVATGCDVGTPWEFVQLAREISAQIGTKVECYTNIISFSHDDIDPGDPAAREKALKVAEIANHRLYPGSLWLGGEHIDNTQGGAYAHVHSLDINFDARTGHALRQNKNLYKVRQMVNDVCKEHGLSVMKPYKERMKDKTLTADTKRYLKQHKNVSKDWLREHDFDTKLAREIDALRFKAQSLEDFRKKAKDEYSIDVIPRYKNKATGQQLPEDADESVADNPDTEVSGLIYAASDAGTWIQGKKAKLRRRKASKFGRLYQYKMLQKQFARNLQKTKQKQARLTAQKQERETAQANAAKQRQAQSKQRKEKQTAVIVGAVAGIEAAKQKSMNLFSSLYEQHINHVLKKSGQKLLDADAIAASGKTPRVLQNTRAYRDAKRAWQQQQGDVLPIHRVQDFSAVFAGEIGLEYPHGKLFVDPGTGLIVDAAEKLPKKITAKARRRANARKALSIANTAKHPLKVDSLDPQRPELLPEEYKDSKDYADYLSRFVQANGRAYAARFAAEGQAGARKRIAMGAAKGFIINLKHYHKGELMHIDAKSGRLVFKKVALPIGGTVSAGGSAGSTGTGSGGRAAKRPAASPRKQETEPARPPRAAAKTMQQKQQQEQEPAAKQTVKQTGKIPAPRHTAKPMLRKHYGKNAKLPEADTSGIKGGSSLNWPDVKK